ncbi:MAG TPA: hypothetical protein VMR25_20355 [Planctomycetaceae bacterium]|jgi:hypothetical protein|nr:hypothetical protein [Planctomycetaceae bacterium]
MTEQVDHKRRSHLVRLAILVAILFVGPVGAYYASSAILLRRDAPPSVPVSASDARKFARTYLRGSKFNMRLTLRHDGTYAGTYNDGTDDVGTASGNWAVSDSTLTLSPYRETGQMKGALRQLEVVQTDRGVVLIPPDGRENFKKFGINHLFCFHTLDQLK